MDWQISTVSPTLVPVFWGLIRTPLKERNAGEIEKARKKLSANLSILDTHLKNSKYIGGENFTMGDIPIGITAYRWFNMEMEREPYQDLKRWYDLLCDRPPFQEHIMQPLE